MHYTSRGLPSVRTARLRVFESDACCAWLKLHLLNALLNIKLLAVTDLHGKQHDWEN